MFENLLKFFFICGIRHSPIRSLPMTDIIKQIPTILSFYSFEGLNEEVKLIKRILENTNQLEIIFPKKFKSSELENYFHENHESKTPNVLEGYIVESKDKPSSFYHATEIKYSENAKEISWYLGIMIFYEQLLEQKINKNNIFIAKAFILVTKYPNFYLSQILLTNIMEKALYSIYPLEYIIESWFKEINTPIKSSKDEKINSNIFELTLNNIHYQYKYYNYYLLKQCDINFPKMLSLFSYDDIITFADYFFKQNFIIVSSNQPNWIFPVFEFFLSMIHPFNIVEHRYFYRFLTLTNIERSQDYPCLLGIHCDKLPNIVERTLRDKTDKQIFHIEVYRNENGKIQVQKNLNNLKKSMIEEVIQDKKIFETENIKNLIEKIKNYQKENNFMSENPFYKSLNLLEEKAIQKFRGHFLILFLYFFNSIIEDICLSEDKEMKRLSVEVKPRNNSNIQQTTIFDIIDHFNLNSINYTELPYFVLLDELISHFRKQQNSLKNKQLLTIDELSQNKNIIKLDFLPHLITHYLNKFQRLKLRNRKKKYNVKLLIQTNCTGLPLFRYNKNELILVWELSTNVNHTKHNQIINEYEHILIEINVFYNLIKKGVKILSSKDQIDSLLCLGISIVLLNTQKNNDNEKYIGYYFNILYNIFLLTKGFHRNNGFLLTLLFRIMKINKKLFAKEKEEFITHLINFNIIPNTSFRIEYSDKTELSEIFEKYIPYNFYIYSLQQLNICTGLGHCFNDISKSTFQLQCSKCKKMIECEVCYSISSNKNAIKSKLKIKNPKIVYLEFLELIMKNKTLNLNKLLMNNHSKQDVIDLLINIEFYSNELASQKVKLFKNDY